MQQGGEVSGSRSNRLSVQKQYSSINGISKSLTVSQSTGKVLQRYFYRRQSANEAKLQLLKIKKLHSDKGSSFHQHNKSAKNTVTKGNEQDKQGEMNTELPLLNLQRLSSFEEPQKVVITPKYEKIIKKSSEWTVVHKKTNHYSKKKSYAQSTQFKLKIQTKNTKQKYQTGSSSTHVDMLLRKHKAGNIKQIQQKLRSNVSRTANQSQRYISLKDFNRKCGYNETQKIYIWNSEDDYIKRILNRWGWVQNQSLESPFFHLKWTYMPGFTDAKISDKQFINHFKNSQQITSKSYLSKNLKQNQSSYGKIDYYYPKCFDVGNSSQLLFFVQEYQQNVMLILLKKIHRYLSQRAATSIKKYDSIYEYFYKHDPYHSELDQKHHNKSVFRNKGFRSIEMEDYKNLNKKCILHIHLVIQTLKYWRNFRKQKEEYFDTGYHFLQFNKEHFHSSFYDLKKYSSFDDIGCPNEQNNFTKELFSTPSQKLIERVSKQYQFCKNTGHLFPTYGENNIWIVKPASNSRGNGIYLTRDLYEIQSSGRGIQSRLVQKYIEKPLLIKNPFWSELYQRKFDIRQWVLINSIQPLQIYMFSECYIRLCYDKYDEKQIDELNRHLTNYSINKLKFKNKNESVLPLSYLRKVLLQQYKISWENTIKPQISEIIIKSIKSCIENLEDFGGNCFQLLGFDILIDQEFTPWLLEINMSPACQERTPWLTDYLSDMGTGLLKLVLPKQLIPQEVDSYNFKYKWEIVEKQQACLNRRKDIQPNLQVIGVKIDLDEQKNVDKLLVENKMATKIQKFFKDYLPKYKQFKLKRKQKQQVIQKYFKTGSSINIYQDMKRLYYEKRMNQYVKAFAMFTSFQNRITKINVVKIEKYFKGACSADGYEMDLADYKKSVMIQLSNIVVKKKQIQMFCRQIKSMNVKVRNIQSKCRQFLSFKKSKRYFLQKYVKTILQNRKYEKEKEEIEIKQHREILYKYMKPLYLSRHAQQKIVEKKQKLICTYLGSLLKRNQFYSRRLQNFVYIVGRVERVTKRRTRCNYFKDILTEWKGELEKERQRFIEIENNKLKLLLANAKQMHKKDSEKGLKVGCIKASKKK